MVNSRVLVVSVPITADYVIEAVLRAFLYISGELIQ